MAWQEAIFSAKRRQERLAYWRSLSLKELWPLLAAVFLLFSVLGFIVDLFRMGREPVIVAISWSVFCGAVAVAYILVLSRRPGFMPLLIGAHLVLTFLLSHLTDLPQPLKAHAAYSPEGIRFAAAGALSVVMGSYGFFLVFIQSSGVKAVRDQTELAVAHSIQQRLVPVIDVKKERFEIFAQSRPSEMVGGDLAALVEREGMTYAYVADVSGHGMQSGLLMNMLTTAIRTALLDAPSITSMLQRVNSVLPEIKEPQMYTTFAGLSFRNAGEVEVALCGHPPVLWLQKSSRTVSRLSESELPVGLFPSVTFKSVRSAAGVGDIYALVTDGILEASSRSGEEFGLERVEALLIANSGEKLNNIAQRIFAAVDAFAPQVDDQTLLLLRLL